MLDISRRLLHYKRKEVQEAIVESCNGREVGTRYGANGFGKRPDILVYGNDVLESVKKGATSFHVSEERWSNPLELSTEMKKHEIQELRSGWDLVLDVDCPFWYYSKLTTHLFISALKRHGINAVSCKFSGNKGFHIGIPFEAFPEEINSLPAKDWFPEGPKKIALYLLEYISKNMIEVKKDGSIMFDNIHTSSIDELSRITGKTKEELSRKICINCRKKAEQSADGKAEFACPRCNYNHVAGADVNFMQCPRCNIIMSRFEKGSEWKCKGCGTKEMPKEVFDPLSIVNIDTILISARHMYRAPYSMHEKSGLVSIPVDIDKVLSFEKDMAAPEKIKQISRFMAPAMAKKDECKNLMIAAFDFGKEEILYKDILAGEEGKEKKYKEFADIGQAIPVELFPPCMLKILEGLEDGKKRSLFILMNFLSSVGWSYEQSEELLQKWNQKNKPPLLERDITQQVRYSRQKNKKILPPNCRVYYQDFSVCFPDSLCEKIKNPVQYAKRKAFAMNKPTIRRPRLSEAQKQMRKDYRERLKNKKSATDSQ